MGKHEITVPVQESGQAPQQVAVHVGEAAGQPGIAHVGLGAGDERLLMPGEVTGLLEPGSTGQLPQIRKDPDGIGDDISFRRFAEGTPQDLSEEARAARAYGSGHNAHRGSIAVQGLKQDRLDMVTHSDEHPRTGF